MGVSVLSPDHRIYIYDSAAYHALMKAEEEWRALPKLLQTFPTIQASRVSRVALWLLGEYCVSAEQVAAAFTKP